MGTAPLPVAYSIVVPLYNEQESVPQLYVKIIDVMDAVGEPFEIVFVDDGSKDGTFRQLSEIARDDGRVLVVRLRRNFGQTAALKAGFDHSRRRHHHFHGRRSAARSRARFRSSSKK